MRKCAVAGNWSACLGDLLDQFADVTPGDRANRTTAPCLHGVTQGQLRLPPVAVAYLAAAPVEVLLDVQFDSVAASGGFGLLRADLGGALAFAWIAAGRHHGTRLGRADTRCTQRCCRVFADRQLGWPLG